MSGKFLKSISVVVTGAVVGYFSIQVILPGFGKTSTSSPNRFLASATMSKLGTEQYAKSYFDIRIKNDVIAFTKDEVSTVKVIITAYQKLPAGLTYSWHLPEGATIVQGIETAEIPQLDADQVQEFELKIKGYSKEFKNHVVFAVKGDLNQSQINQNVIVSSRPEDSFEYVVQEHEMQKAVEAQAKKKMGKSSSKSPFDPKNVVF
jgi:hypothetical protein